MLVLRNASRPLGKGLLLDQASLEIKAGAPAAILGLSLAEQEGLLRLLEGTDKPSSGSVTLGGKDVAQVRRKRGGIVRIGPDGAKPTGQRVGQLVGQQAVARVRLQGRWAASVRELDQADRVRLAIALAAEAAPDLLLLRSPTSGAAPEAARALLADLAGMFTGLRSVIVLTGNAVEAQALGGPAVVFSQGQTVQTGPLADIRAAPAGMEVAAAVAAPSLNVVWMTARAGAGVLSDGSVFQPPEGLVLPGEGPCTLAFYPDDVTLERRAARCVRFVPRATGEVVQPAGQRYARVRYANAMWLVPIGEQTPARDMMLNVFVDQSRLMVFDADGKAVR